MNSRSVMEAKAPLSNCSDDRQAPASASGAGGSTGVSAGAGSLAQPVTSNTAASGPRRQLARVMLTSVVDRGSEPLCTQLRRHVPAKRSRTKDQIRHRRLEIPIDH